MLLCSFLFHYAINERSSLSLSLSRTFSFFSFMSTRDGMTRRALCAFYPGHPSPPVRCHSTCQTDTRMNVLARSILLHLTLCLAARSGKTNTHGLRVVRRCRLSLVDGSCTMPTAWRGFWYQRGMSTLLEITFDHVQTKGHCLDVLDARNYYLFTDRSALHSMYKSLHALSMKSNLR